MNLFQNALAMEPQNVSILVLFMAVFAWVTMLFVLLADLLADKKMATFWKVFWLPVLVCIPVIGGFFYGAFSLIRSLGDTKICNSANT